MEPTSTFDHAGCTINTYRDEDTEGPREWDNVGTMVCFHRSYQLGDKHDYSEPSEARDFIESVEKDGGLVMPLFLYDHGGITMNTSGFSCQWDSGQVGWIYVTAEKIAEEWTGKTGDTMAPMDRAKNYLRGEVSTYADFLQGNVYGYVVEDEDGEHIDSCWGFYPDEKDNGLEPALMVEQAKDAAEGHREDRDKLDAIVAEASMIDAARNLEASRPDMYGEIA